jgi:ferredoxin
MSHISGSPGKDNPEKQLGSTSRNEISASSTCEAQANCGNCRGYARNGRICRFTELHGPADETAVRAGIAKRW